MRDTDKIAEVVRETLAADFENIKVLDVLVREGSDADGNVLLRVYVVFEGDPQNADVRKLSGAVRHVRPKLSKIGEDAFPLFSFIAKRDVGAGKFEPA